MRDVQLEPIVLMLIQTLNASPALKGLLEHRIAKQHAVCVNILKISLRKMNKTLRWTNFTVHFLICQSDYQSFFVFNFNFLQLLFESNITNIFNRYVVKESVHKMQHVLKYNPF